MTCVFVARAKNLEKIFQRSIVIQLAMLEAVRGIISNVIWDVEIELLAPYDGVPFLFYFIDKTV